MTNQTTKIKALDQSRIETRAMEVKAAARNFLKLLEQIQVANNHTLSQQTIDTLEARLFTRISSALSLTKLEVESFAIQVAPAKRNYRLPAVTEREVFRAKAEKKG